MSGPPPPADLDRRTPSILQVRAGAELHRFYRLKRLHDHPAGADGIVYCGRHDDREPCYAIFSRARRAIEEVGRNPSLNEDWFWAIAEAYGMGLAPG